MTEQLRQRLSPVRARQRRQQMLHCAAAGLLAGAMVAMALGMARMMGATVTWQAMLGVHLGGLIMGALCGLILPSTWMAAAAAIDTCYQLKDRAISALFFSEQTDAGELKQLQITDALEHLSNIEPRRVAPYRMPRALPVAVVVCTASLLLLLVPQQAHSSPAPLETNAVIFEQAELLEQMMVEELQELAEENPDPELEALVEELKELVEELKDPGVDQREALAKLSEMQAAIAEAQAEFNLEAIDAELQSVGEAVSPAVAMQGISEAIQQGEYGKASDQLEQLDPSQISKKEAKTVAENLRKLAKASAGEGTPGEISEAATEIAEGLEEGTPSECKSGLSKLAGICEKQGLRKQIGECLGGQLARLSESKGACNKNGGTGVAKSKNPSNNWGTGASGQPLGNEATAMDTQRNRETITGMQGDGPSEKETTNSPEGEELAGRTYREKYEEYQKMTEAVLDSEPLPLGHRQTIRKYFESIRPQNLDDEQDE